MTCDLDLVYIYTSTLQMGGVETLRSCLMAPLYRGSAARRAKVSIFTAFSWTNGARRVETALKRWAIFWVVSIFLGPWRVGTQKISVKVGGKELLAFFS